MLDKQSGFKPSPVLKRSIVVSGHKTSVSLEDSFWESLKEIAADRDITLSALVGVLDINRKRRCNLSSAVRLYVLAHYKAELEKCLGKPKKAQTPKR